LTRLEPHTGKLVRAVLREGWSSNGLSLPDYVVNELLRFALTQSEDFQKHKADLGTGSSQPNNDAESDPPQSKTKARPATTASATATAAPNSE